MDQQLWCKRVLIKAHLYCTPPCQLLTQKTRRVIELCWHQTATAHARKPFSVTQVIQEPLHPLLAAASTYLPQRALPLWLHRTSPCRRPQGQIWTSSSDVAANLKSPPYGSTA